MARARTVSELETEARQAADMESSSFVTSATVVRRVVQSYTALYDMLVQARGDEYYRTSASAVTVAGTPTVANPATLYKLLGLDYSYGGKIYTAVPMEWTRRNAFQNVPWSRGRTVHYQLEGANTRFWPTPDAVYTLTYWFVPAPAAASVTGGTSLDGVAGWEDWIVWDVATWLRIKEETDAQECMLERQKVEQRIAKMAPRRNRSGPERPRDVRSRMYAPPDEWDSDP